MSHSSLKEGDQAHGELAVRTIKEAQASPPTGSRYDNAVVIRDMVPGVFFGWDTRGLTVGKEGNGFQGIREFPAGIHFIYTGAGDMSIRAGLWIHAEQLGKNPEILLKRWDQYHECLEDVVSDEEGLSVGDVAGEDLFQSLLPYSTVPPSGSSQQSGGTRRVEGPKQDADDTWPRLTSCITGDLLCRITGQSRGKWKVSSTDDAKNPAIKQRDTVPLPGEVNDRTFAQFTEKENVLDFAFRQNSKTYTKNATGRERTEQALDTSSHILAIIEEFCHQEMDDIVGELQFSFICGMLLGNIACLEQWSWIIRLIFRAYNLSTKHPALFTKLTNTFHAQIQYNEEGLEGSIFDHDPSLEAELKLILTTFKSRLTEHMLLVSASDPHGAEEIRMGDASRNLESYLEKSMGWDLSGDYLRSGRIQLEDGEEVDAEMEDFEAEDERGEYAPVVVDDLTEEQKRILGLDD